MYPLKYRLTLGILLSALFLLLSYFSFRGVALLQTDTSYLVKVSSYASLVFLLAIISSPIIFGSSWHWLIFFISAAAVFLYSQSTKHPAHNLSSLILLGVCVPTHIFFTRKFDIAEEKTSAVEKIKESTNILKSKIAKTQQLNNALLDRLARYRNLRAIGESFSARLSLEDICQLAVETAFHMIPDSDAAVLFVVDEIRQELSLCASKIKDELPRIKSKTGDIFDRWVFKERQPLNVEDINEDFRFDYKPIEKEREFKSLISVPLISQDRIIGILRINNTKKNAYTFDDLRLLDFISDLASNAINNARLYKRTEELSTKDSLTGFYVHRYMKERLRDEIRRARLNNQPLSVIMMDIDHFKDYNDRYGHSAGDKVLLGIAEIMRNSIKDSYIIARYGGEEFVIILPSTDIDRAKLAAEDIRKNISQKKFILRRQETSVTISAGVCASSGDIKDEEELLKKADLCLYTAKKEGRNRICVA